MVLVVTGLCADGYYWWQERWRRADLRVTHLNVGQGDAAVVELPGSKVLLLDAGGTAFGDFDPGESIVAPFLRARKILKVDYLAVTHPRIDHYGGMRAIAAEFSPTEFWSGDGRGKPGALRIWRRRWHRRKFHGDRSQRASRAAPSRQYHSALCLRQPAMATTVPWCFSWNMASCAIYLPAISINAKKRSYCRVRYCRRAAC